MFACPSDTGRALATARGLPRQDGPARVRQPPYGSPFIGYGGPFVSGP